MKQDFTSNIKNNLNTDTKDKNEEPAKPHEEKPLFKLERKTSEKTNKRAFNITMDNELIKKLDTIAKKSGYSRNELISIMCNYCSDNLELI